MTHVHVNACFVSDHVVTTDDWWHDSYLRVMVHVLIKMPIDGQCIGVWLTCLSVCSVTSFIRGTGEHCEALSFQLSLWNSCHNFASSPTLSLFRINCAGQVLNKILQQTFTYLFLDLKCSIFSDIEVIRACFRHWNFAKIFVTFLVKKRPIKV